MAKFKLGTEVYYTIGRGKNKRTIQGRITEYKPEIAPGTKYKITSNNGEIYYPVLNVKRRVRP